MSHINETDKLNLKLAVECADAFFMSTGLGCTVSDLDGIVLHEVGYNCRKCSFCSTVKNHPDSKLTCRKIHMYGMAQSERFGGKYIYFCPMGLTCFVSPIMGENEGIAKITVGPLLMVDYEDFVQYDLKDKLHLSGKQLELTEELLQKIPRVSPERVTYMSNLLFMAVGFLNNVAVCNKMLDTQNSDAMQGQISDFLMQLKGKNPHGACTYPFKKERELVQSIAGSDKINAQRLLNELLGNIFFASGGDFAKIKSRVYELLVLMSRAAIDGGADPEHALRLNDRYMTEINTLKTVEALCFWLADVMNRFMEMVFKFSDVTHVDVIHKAVQYTRKNFENKILLEEVASHVFLSPSYFSKIFKQEMGCNFNTYLNNIRIEKSKKLLLLDNIKLVDIAHMVGYEDQSYFSKVFKKLTGVAPCKYKESKGRIKCN